jgi:hypothetical protein
MGKPDRAPKKEKDGSIKMSARKIDCCLQAYALQTETTGVFLFCAASSGPDSALYLPAFRGEDAAAIPSGFEMIYLLCILVDTVCFFIDQCLFVKC